MIGKNRITKKTESILEKYYKDGFIPGQDKLAREIDNYMRSINLEEPEYKPIDLQPFSRFDVEEFNNILKILHADLELLYDENISITEEIVRQVSFQDSIYKSQKNALESAKSDLEDLLLTTADTAGVIGSFSDDFLDLSKVDADNTTADINLDLGIVTLKERGSETMRVELPSRSMLGNYQVVVLQPEPNYIVRQIPIAGADDLANIVDDTLSSWQYTVTTVPEYDKKVVIEVTIPLVKDLENPPEVSRIDLKPMTWSTTGIRIYYSNDMINWLYLPGHSTTILTKGGTITLRFPTINAKAIKIEMEKGAPDNREDYSEYHFGIQTISLFRMGYSLASDIQSKGFNIQDDFAYSVNKASLYVDDNVPAGTKINYKIGAVNTDGDIFWSDIVPVNKEGSPKVVGFDQHRYTSPFSNIVTFNSSPPSGVFGGLPFFTIDAGAPNNILPNKGQLFWLNAWKVGNPQLQFRPKKQIRGNQIYLGPNEDNRMQFLYIDEEEVLPTKIITGVPQTFTYLGGIQEVDLGTIMTGFDIDSVLELPHDLLFDNGGNIPITAAAQIGNTDDVFRRPDTGGRTASGSVWQSNQPTSAADASDMAYSVKRVVHIYPETHSDLSLDAYGSIVVRNTARNRLIRGKRSKTREVYLAINERVPYLTSAKVYLEYTVNGRKISGYYRVRVAKVLDQPDTGSSYLENGLVGASSYLRIIEALEGKPVSELVISNLVDYVGYDVSPTVTWKFIHIDITHLVTNIDGKKIYIDKSYPRLKAGSKVLVDYRRLLTDEEEVVTESVEVFKNGQKGSEPSPFVLERDYAVDKNTGAFRLKEGSSIPIISYRPTKLVVNFDYLEAPIDQYIYSTYFSRKMPLQSITFSDLSLRDDMGDRFYVKPEGKDLVDVTKSSEIPNLPAGYTKAVVYSTRFTREDDTINTDSALYKVATAIDSDGDLIFNGSSKYWDAQVPDREPLKQISFINLTRNTPINDNRFFSIYNGEVWTNFNPYKKMVLDREYIGITGLNAGITGLNVTGIVGLTDTASLGYSYVEQLTSTKFNISGIVFKAEMSRDATYDGDITPYLDKYSIRLF